MVDKRVRQTTSYLLGVDIGTQGTKAALFSSAGQTCATSFHKSRRHEHADNVVEEDPEYQLTSVCAGIRKCVSESGIDPRRIAALAIAGQMAGVIGMGEDGKCVTPYDSWLDTRCGPYIDEMNRIAAKEIIRKTGGPASFNHGPKILWWKHERPKLYKRVAAFVQPGGYAALRLCGLDAADAFIDKSYLHFSGFANNRRACWDSKLCQRFDVEASKLPRIVDSHDLIGEMTPRMARRCGVRAGLPVVAGCGDTAASFLACGATREGICVDVAGTASVFAATSGQFNADTRFGVLAWGRSTTPGLWHPYAYINGGGMNLEWFAREFAAAGGRTSGVTLEQLDRRVARSPPQATDPMFVPHWGGRNSPAQPELRGSWAGLTWSHRAIHLYRAALEGVALEYCIYLDVLRKLNPELRVREVRVTGGGEKSGAWNSIKADALGVKVVQVTRSEGAPMGAAMLAGFGIGLFDKPDQVAKQWLTTGKVVRPNKQLASHYAVRQKRYCKLLNALNEWSRP